MRNLIYLFLLISFSISAQKLHIGVVASKSSVISNDVYEFDATTNSYFILDQNDMLNGIVTQSWVVEAKVTGGNTFTKGFFGVAGSLQFEVEVDNLLDARLNDTGTSTINNISWAQDEIWHIFILTYDTTNGFEIFEDNVSLGTNVSTGFTGRTNGRVAELGRAAGQPYEGQIRTIQFYSSVLTSTERSNLQTDITDVGANLVANFAQQKITNTWTSEVGGWTATNQGSVVLTTK